MAQQWGVTFATGTQSVSFPSTGYEGFDVEVLRAKSSEATTINLSATLVVGDKEQELPASITVPSSVSFAAGEFKTNIHVTVGDITPGQNYKSQDIFAGGNGYDRPDFG